MENPIPKFSVCRLKFVRLGSNCRVEVGGGQTFFLKVRIVKIRVLGWLDTFRAVKLGLKHYCEKHPYICSLSSIGTGDVVRRWVGL